MSHFEFLCFWLAFVPHNETCIWHKNFHLRSLVYSLMLCVWSKNSRTHVRTLEPPLSYILAIKLPYSLTEMRAKAPHLHMCVENLIVYCTWIGLLSAPLCIYDKVYWIKPSLHTTNDSCILQLVTSATCFGLAWPSSGLQRLVSIKVHNVAVPIGTATLCTLIDTNVCKPDDGQARPKHVADVTSCRIQLSIVLCKDGLIQ